MNELEELNLLNQLIELGAKAAHAHAQSNSDDGHKGTAAYVQWHELRAEMGELIRAAYAPQADSVLDEALSQAARDVLAERHRQINTEGWTPEHDDEHSPGEMAEAAACYAASAQAPASLKRRQCSGYWPWAAKWWKPSDTRRDLIKAGALILAELERIDRAARKKGGA